MHCIMYMVWCWVRRKHFRASLFGGFNRKRIEVFGRKRLLYILHDSMVMTIWCTRQTANTTKHYRCEIYCVAASNFSGVLS